MWRDLQLALSSCKTLGVQISREKLEGPTTQMEFPCIQLDTVRLELCLPEANVGKLTQTIQQWRTKQSCTKQELLPLIGQLQHACKSGTIRKNIWRAQNQSAWSNLAQNEVLEIAQNAQKESIHFISACGLNFKLPVALATHYQVCRWDFRVSPLWFWAL